MRVLKILWLCLSLSVPTQAAIVQLPEDPSAGSLPVKQLIRGSDGVLYILSGGTTTGSISRWSLTDEKYLPLINLSGAFDYFAYSEKNNTIYLANEAGTTITQINLDVSSTEIPFATAPNPVCGIVSTGKNLFVCTKYDHTWTILRTYAPDGSLIDSTDKYEPAISGHRYHASEYTWSEINQRLYFIRDRVSPSDVMTQQINRDGTVGAEKESPYHTTNGGWMPPVRVDPLGRKLVLGQGRVMDADTLSHMAQLALPSNVSVKDSTWWAGNIITIRQNSAGNTIVEYWRSDYSLQESLEITGPPLHVINAGDHAIVMTIQSGRPSYWKYTPAVLDTDNDGITDFADSYPTDPLRWTDIAGIDSLNDVDGDGWGATFDKFANNPFEWLDNDFDGIGDNTDADDDNDGVIDYFDIEPLNPARSIYQFANFYPQNPNNRWYYDIFGQPVYQAEGININGVAVAPLVFPSGTRLYFEKGADGIGLYGYYLPSVQIGTGQSYNVEVRFDQRFDVLPQDANPGDGRHFSGTGTATINPTYGDRAINYSGILGISGMETITTPFGTYEAMKIRYDIAAYTNINGVYVYAKLAAYVWFTEGVGIIKYADAISTAQLTAAYIEPDRPVQIADSSNSTGSSGGGGGGGCTIAQHRYFDPVLILLLFSVFILLIRNHGTERNGVNPR